TVPAPRAAPAPQAIRVGPATAPVLQVNTGRGRLVTLTRPMSDLFISDDQVADVQVRSPTQLYIFGKKTGETTISATTKGGAVAYSATVRVGNNLDSIGQMLALAMPEARITATPMNGLVLLTGAVAQPEDAAEAERLVQAYVGDGTKVLSRLKAATPLQVNLQVRIAEVSRSFAKNIGANLTNRDSGNFLFGIARGRQGTISNVPGVPPAAYVNGAPVDVAGRPIALDASGAVPGSKLFTQPAIDAGSTLLSAAGRLLGTDLLGSLDLGETIGQVSTLANPNLSCTSGETCNFLVGGEIPIPIAQGGINGAISVEYKQYGVSLAYSPTVLSDGRIALHVRPEVSELSEAGAVQLNGTTIPALSTRRAETTLELGSGQSMVIGGLLSNSHNNSIEKTPGLGDLPVLGALFRSNGWRREETELMIVITPYLVKPVNNPADIVLPTDGLEAPTDAQRLLLGEMGTGKTGAHRPVPTIAVPAAPAPTVGALVPATPVPGRDDRRQGADTRATRRGTAPAPGFSN
ncbi:type II and III secretion system protein family protein, partial [Sphingomonas bacterium]|uniref:type II and III secretion system protein family protein n=1 Tax=Sphingomonas bacterium TaxID=1895847 RepID=UPI00157565DC